MKRAVTIGAVVMGLVLSSCSGDDEEATTSPAPPQGVEAPGESATPPGSPGHPTEFLDCMADQGIDIPPSGQPPPGIDPALAQRAFQACAQFLPPGVGGAHP